MADDVKSTATDKSQVARNTALMSSATLISRVTGFLRTWACAFALGNTLLTSAYQIANTMPNMLYELVAGGVLSTAFLPVYLAQKEKQGDKAANGYVSNVFSIFLVLLGAITLLATIFAPQVIYTQTFLTHGEDSQLATWFFRFFAIQMLFYGISAIVGGVLNANKRFLWPALGPVFNNIVVIITMFGFVPIAAHNPQFAKVWLAVGTSLGIFVQMLVQIPALLKSGFRFKFRIDLHDPAIRETARLAIPAIIFTIINLVCVSMRNAFALRVTPLGASAISYAWLWYQLPYGVLGVALSTAMFTEMSQSAARGDMDRFRDNVRGGLRATFFLIIPMAVLLAVMSDMLITLYHAGAFTADDISMVAGLLRWWALCLPFYAGYMYLYFAFSSLKDLKTVTKANLGASVIQIGLYALLTMGVGSWAGVGLAGIPMADTCFFALMFVLLIWLLHRRVGSFGFKNVLGLVGATLAAAAAGGAVAFALDRLMGSTTSIGMAFLHICVAGGMGLFVTFLVARNLRIEEQDIIDRLMGRILAKLGIRIKPRKRRSDSFLFPGSAPVGKHSKAYNAQRKAELRERLQEQGVDVDARLEKQRSRRPGQPVGKHSKRSK